MKLISDYLGREQCDSVKGIFILTVFFAHFMQYVRMAGGHAIDIRLGQMIVTLFLFYSGYGVMESIKKKGDEYVKSMPKRRILTTLLNFDVAVLAFILLDLLLGRSITIKQSFLSFVCWDSVGNSNWYIFAIIVCYLTAFIACYKSQFRRWGGVISFVILSFVMLALALVKDSWWYDTILCFPAGMIYSQYKSRIEVLCSRFWWPVMLSLGLATYILLRRWSPIVYGFGWNAKAIIFAFTVVLITMRIPVRHKAIGWCGRNLFPLYIYQRIPMLALFTLDPQGFATWRMPIYFFICFIITLAIAKLYPKWQVKL